MEEQIIMKKTQPLAVTFLLLAACDPTAPTLVLDDAGAHGPADSTSLVPDTTTPPRPDRNPIDAGLADFGSTVDSGHDPVDTGHDAGFADTSRPDAVVDRDAGHEDARPRPDVGFADARPRDAESKDMGFADARPADSGFPDADPPDLGFPDAGHNPIDSGVVIPPDAGFRPDAGFAMDALPFPDATAPDADPPDAGFAPDADPPDAGCISALASHTNVTIHGGVAQPTAIVDVIDLDITIVCGSIELLQVNTDVRPTNPGIVNNYRIVVPNVAMINGNTTTIDISSLPPVTGSERLQLKAVIDNSPQPGNWQACLDSIDYRDVPAGRIETMTINRCATLTQ